MRLDNQIATIKRNGFMSTYWTLVAFVKRYSVLWWGKLRQPQAVAETAFVADSEFLGQHQVEQVEVAHLGLIRPLDVLVQGFGQVRQAELGGGGADAGAGQLAQRASLVAELAVKGAGACQLVVDRQRTAADLDMRGGGPVQQSLQRSGCLPAAGGGQSVAGGDAAPAPVGRPSQ